MFSLRVNFLAVCVIQWSVVGQATDTWQPIVLEHAAHGVAPMTGIVLWDDNDKNTTDAIQLEYSYVGYDQIVSRKGVHDWQTVDAKLAAIAAHSHQAVLRFYFDYVGKPTTVPAYIKQLKDYSEVTVKSEGKPTGFCDWSHSELQTFTIEFYSEFAKRYDSDRRLAFLQTGFGLWAEYHIYDGPMQLGKTFPNKAFQARFAKHLDTTFKQLPWMISVDAADEKWSPMAKDDALRSLRFGLFDDSFLSKEHPKVNALNWQAFGNDRWKRMPAGGEFSYYNKRDQRMALALSGPNGESFDKAAARFHISFMIGDDQAKYQSLDHKLSTQNNVESVRSSANRQVRSAFPYSPKVTDFGLAKQLHGDSELTGTGQVLGTPRLHATGASRRPSCNGRNAIGCLFARSDSVLHVNRTSTVSVV